MRCDGGACVAVDVRALQSPMSAERGIGRYTLDCLTTLERRHPELVTWYVFDPELPIHTNLSAFEPSGKLRPQGHPDLHSSVIDLLHIASPWEAVSIDALLPEWVVPGRTAVVATVFDLIPMVFPDVYLSDVRVRVGFTVRAAALDVVDRIVTISEASGRDVTRLLEVPPERVHVIHGGTAPHFVAPSRPRSELRARVAALLPQVRERPYVLAPLGIEPRKNIGRLIEAYARIDPHLRERHPLVVQCAARPHEIEPHLDAAAGLGCAGQVSFTGYVTDEDLVTLYQAAELVVFPSVYEGLGLPVLEARRCGAVVVCGDNSSLREVQPDARARFDATDVGAITTSMVRALTDEDLRAELAAAPVDDRYEWATVADELAGVYRSTLAAAPRATRRRRTRRPRLALSSPAPPNHAGPAVYLGQLLEHLPDLCDVTLLTAADASLVQVDPRVQVETLEALDVIEQVHGPFDEVVYFLGNSEHHIAQEYFLRRRPGAVVLHDARLVGLYREMSRLAPQLLPEPGLLPTLLGMYPGRYDASLRSSDELTQDDVVRLGILMVGLVARHATELYVHSEHAADMVEHDCGRRPEVIFGLPFPEQSDPVMGPDPSDPVAASGDRLVASFGVLSPLKGSGLLVQAVAATRPDTHLALVGDVDEAYAAHLRRLADDLGVGDRVTLTGAVEDGEYRRWLARADVAVQLRMVSNGESSAALNDVIAAGVPSVVSSIGSFRDLPEGLAVMVEPDIDPRRLAATLMDVLDDPARRRAMSERGRSYAAAHTYRDAAESLVDRLLG